MRGLIKIKFLSIAILLLVFTNNIFAQCAMCKAVVETNLNAGDTKGAGLNDGILFLMAIPYFLIFTFGLFYYLNKRKITEKVS
tara:strand:- start:7699 stop:7947 length:249 start_codon:yes stop_codon:yes gene_type:complete